MSALISRLVEFLRTHILGIISVGIFCSVAASYIYGWLRPQAAKTPPHFSPTPALLYPTPTDADAPIVTFRDGRRAAIEFSIVTRILEEDAAKVVAYAGDGEHARAVLEPPTVAAVYALLEPLTYEQARTRRLALESTLLDTLKPRYKAAELTIDSISLKAITLLPARKRP
jgi:hypothetical protein